MERGELGHLGADLVLGKDRELAEVIDALTHLAPA
jgi:hypothetical protein